MVQFPSIGLSAWVAIALALSGLFSPIPVQALEPHDQIEWSELVDVEAQNFEDPFTELDSTQLSQLSEIARIRQDATEGSIEAELMQKAETRLEVLEGKLRAQGVDVDWLISQRWIVAERRHNAYWRGNAELRNKRVSLVGYVVPTMQVSTGELVAFFVPQAGMCSHLPPPPPNQLIRIGDAKTEEMVFGRMEPVEIIGTLIENRSTELVNVVDGLLEMKSSWLLEAESVVRDSTSEPAMLRPGILRK
ncbi:MULTISPECIES: DUF3299 domain-containing protein [unclassified Ruegeria]|uniref:DUF3299 domain-containing protein n=1 Tax=unclassified Ruegeria TaxID=2625375 RepID=UPI001491E86D|nr:MULTISPECIES: DUF3299 domain-containing protein [unclassified Ruegeria]NOG07353.1 DUF3299 domain-containing protein [Ruegeria sp. HKCCD4315]